MGPAALKTTTTYIVGFAADENSPFNGVVSPFQTPCLPKPQHIRAIRAPAIDTSNGQQTDQFDRGFSIPADLLPFSPTQSPTHARARLGQIDCWAVENSGLSNPRALCRPSIETVIAVSP